MAQSQPDVLELGTALNSQPTKGCADDFIRRPFDAVLAGHWLPFDAVRVGTGCALNHI